MCDNYYILINGKRLDLDDRPYTLVKARKALTAAGIERAIVWFDGCETPMSLTSDKPITRHRPKLRLIQGGR